jgi:hypothetical protein
MPEADIGQTRLGLDNLVVGHRLKDLESRVADVVLNRGCRLQGGLQEGSQSEEGYQMLGKQFLFHLFEARVAIFVPAIAKYGQKERTAGALGSEHLFSVQYRECTQSPTTRKELWSLVS